MNSQKNKIKTIQKIVRKESQVSRSVDDGNIFNQGLDDSGYQNIFFNCLKNLEKMVTETFNLAKTVNKNQLKACVRYTFASLFCTAKIEHFWNKGKCFLLHFETSFRSWDNQILTFQIFQCYDVINASAWNMKKHILLNKLGSKRSLVIKFDQFM